MMGYIYSGHIFIFPVISTVLFGLNFKFVFFCFFYFYCTVNYKAANGYYASRYRCAYVRLAHKTVFISLGRGARLRALLRCGCNDIRANAHGKTDKKHGGKKNNCDFFHNSLSNFIGFIDFQSILW